MGSWLYEGLLLFGVIFIAGYLFGTLTQTRNAMDNRLALQAFLFCVLAVYFVWFWTRGQTLAMKTWRIRVVDVRGRALTQHRALLRYLLKVEEKDAAPEVELKHSKMILRVRPATSYERKQEILEAWYREQLKEAVPALFAKWEPLMGVKVGKLFVQKMKTKWGGCSPDTSSIRLNTDLAKKPPECLEYLVVHEMAHLLEPTHNSHFIALMDQFMPKWRFYKEELNRLPVRHESWGY